MKRPQNRLELSWLATLCLVLAFQLHQQQVLALNEQQHNSQQEHSNANSQSLPILSMGSESSSALESSAALAGDDLIAAESSQSPEAAEQHKAFTSNQPMMRQETVAQQLAASVAPVVFAAPNQPVAGQQQQQQQHPVGQQQMMQSLQPQHMHLQARMAHQAALHQKPFNPLMAAALAGNYAQMQQQMAAAAAANLHHQAHPQQHPQQHHPNQVHHQQQMVSQHQQQHQHQQMVNHGVQQQQVAREQSVQENNGRHNFDSSNSIEPQEGSQTGVGQALAASASGQHPVIAAASSVMQEQASSAWPLQAPDIPKIVNLEVKCEKNLMKVSIEFDKVFNGVIFSKGHYNQGQCVHVGQNSGKQQAYFDISINSCGTQGNTQNGLYGMGGNTGSGTYFENTIVVQYDPNVQEVYDHARKLRCTWHDQYEKAVTFRPFPVDMLDIVRADFAGDNVGCWMQIQVGKGPWASEVAGIVKIGQTMTMVLAIKDEENKFDMLVRNCFAHDGKRGPIELVDKSGCITRPKLMTKFNKIKNFGSSATVLSYAHFQAFKFPDSMEVHFQCTIQICRHQCPDQCSASSNGLAGAGGETFSESTISGTFNINGGAAHSASQGAGQASGSSDLVHLRKYGSPAAALSRERRSIGGHSWNSTRKAQMQTVGLNRIIQVVSPGDLAFVMQPQQQLSTNSTGDQQLVAEQLTRLEMSNQVCVSSYNFVLSVVVLIIVLLCSSLIAISLFMRQRSIAKRSSSGKLLCNSPVSSTCASPSSTMRMPNVPSKQQIYSHHHHQQQHNLNMFDASKMMH